MLIQLGFDDTVADDKEPVGVTRRRRGRPKPNHYYSRFPSWPNSTNSRVSFTYPRLAPNRSDSDQYHCASAITSAPPPPPSMPPENDFFVAKCHIPIKKATDPHVQCARKRCRVDPVTSTNPRSNNSPPSTYLLTAFKSARLTQLTAAQRRGS
jgi:hypothetical protein